jgi:hypothetical protein
MPDQPRADALGSFGKAVASTPSFDAQARRGVELIALPAVRPSAGVYRVVLTPEQFATWAREAVA